MLAAVNNGAGDIPLPASAGAMFRVQVGRALEAPEIEDQAVFGIATPTDGLVAAYGGALLREGLRSVPATQFRDAIALALEESQQAKTITAEEYERFKSVFERFEALEPWDEATQGKMPWDRRILAAEFARLEQWAAVISPYYQELREQQSKFLGGYQRVACRFALRFWERHEGECVVHGTEATAATVALLDDDERRAIAAAWFELKTLPAHQKKASNSPSPSPSDRSGSPRTRVKRPTDRGGDSSD